jgi:uncharacterized protein YpmS
MVLIHHFNSTTLWKAFILNALTTSLVILIAIIVKRRLDEELNVNQNQPDEKSSFDWYSTTVTFLITFGTSLTAYLIMYIVFGFGGGMLANT